LANTAYEAISYVWGKSKKNKKIICDGRVIRITKSLSDVLRRLRLPHKRRKLWADGICINQDDLEEKGHQVAIMGDIYRSAKRVLIYMGPEDGGHGPQVCSLLADVGRMIHDTYKQIDMSWDSFPYPEDNDPLLSDSRWKSMFYLLSQDWFERGWVVREAAFAQDGLVIWHQSEFHWEAFVQVWLWLARRAHVLYWDPECPESAFICHSKAFRQRRKPLAKAFYPESSWQSDSLLESLNSASTLQLSDPRDRIYAFMELSENFGQAITIRPDYNSKPMEVYRQFAIHYIQEINNIRILDYVNHAYDSTYGGIPSWVPRWNVSTRSIAAHIPFNDTLLTPKDGSICEPKIIDCDTVLVRGVLTDSVQYVSDTFQRASTTRQSVVELWETISPMLKDSTYEPSIMLDAFLDILCLGISLGDKHTWLGHKDAFKRYIQVEHEGFVSSEVPHQEHSSSVQDDYGAFFLDLVADVMNHKRFVVTKRGYMGLAPAITQEDDICAIIFGCLMPCILQVTATKHYYRFRGSTSLIGKEHYGDSDEGIVTVPLGHDDSKEWVDWDVEEQDIYLV
jgi:hypothetical protein